MRAPPFALAAMMVALDGRSDTIMPMASFRHQPGFSLYPAIEMQARL
jgi:hypothetical protein